MVTTITKTTSWRRAIEDSVVIPSKFNVPYDHLQQVEGFALGILPAFAVSFAVALVGLDKVFQDLHHGLLLDVAQAAVIKQGLQSLSSACWLLKLQQQLVLVCGRDVNLHSICCWDTLQHVQGPGMLLCDRPKLLELHSFFIQCISLRRRLSILATAMQQA